MISFNCACGEPLAAAPEHAGLQVQCPKCNAVLVVPAAESEFEYADDTAPPPPPKKKPILVEDEPPSKRSAAPPPPPKKKKPVVLEDEEEPAPAKKKAKLVDDEEDDRKPKKKKKKKRNYGDDDEPEHVKRLMAQANAELDEEEARHKREGGGIAITPGIIAGIISMLLGMILLVVMVCVGFFSFYLLILCGVLIVGGGVRVVLSFTGQGVD